MLHDCLYKSHSDFTDIFPIYKINLNHQKHDSMWNVLCIELLFRNLHYSHLQLFVFVDEATQTNSKLPHSQNQECNSWWKRTDWLWKSGRPSGTEQERRQILKDLLSPNHQGWDVSSFKLPVFQGCKQERIFNAGYWSRYLVNSTHQALGQPLYIYKDFQ